jgi:hypothetical protein
MKNWFTAVRLIVPSVAAAEDVRGEEAIRKQIGLLVCDPSQEEEASKQIRP